MHRFILSGLRRPLILAAATALWFSTVMPAMAEKRIGLVIGNSAYRHASKLPNTANDAAAMSVLLKSAGFDVVETRSNLGISDMRRAIRDFSNLARDADMAVVFFAGHGIEVNGSNYLVPVDAALERDIDVEDETVSLERVLTVLEPTRLRLIILDACRDNPFTKTMKRTIASRAIGRGLARVEPMTSDTLIAFAAKAGSIAIDGTGTHSPFTAALLKHIATPGLDLRIAFGRVRDEVLKSTGKKQEPFVYGSLGGNNVALVSLPADESGVGPSTPSSDPTTAQAWRDYELAAKVGTKAAWDAFLAKHPTGFYADLARAHRAKIIAPLPVAVPNKTESPTTPTDRAEPRKKAQDAKPVKRFDKEPPKKNKSATRSAKSNSYPSCTAEYQASYHQSLRAARSIGVTPTAMIAQYRRQCGPN
jgi:hypothetical protein